jgi:hypothetical protein
MAQLDPVAERSISFLFTRCQARLDGADLVVAVPAPQVQCRAGGGASLHWDAPHPVGSTVRIECEPGAHVRADGAEYPVAQTYPAAVEFRFSGAVWYGRVPLRHGWALCVQGAVQSIAGLPADWTARDAILVETTYTAPERPPPQEGPDLAQRMTDGGGPVNGPHLPYP